ncbi:MAG: hypothetical protein JSU96_04635 [Acidobacteriota bacterium]|nr:MAG: hypothetical protein JSU96_04635 [Acidobacteriota bacterium]
MVGLNAVIVAVTDESPRVLTVRGSELSMTDDHELAALPFGPLDAEKDRTLERGVRGWVREQTGLELEYVEQLYTFGDRHRHPIEHQGGPRMLSIAYLALIREVKLALDSRAKWLDYYSFLPWEDWRRGRPKVLDQVILPKLEEWVTGTEEWASRTHRQERLAIAFGLGGSEWDGEKVLERYELLYEAGIIDESVRTYRGKRRPSTAVEKRELMGRRMALDHRRMLATALGRLRGKIKYRPVVFELLSPTFRLLQLQRVVEALAGVRLHKQNFRRLVDRGGLVEGTGQIDSETGGRPAELFRFRREVLTERRAPGVGLPTS